jgi:sigma-B regulation protein RsbU (phosphoserine phosphatase)
MNTGTLSRFRENLERQRSTLLQWMGATPAEKKRINLGSVGKEEVQSRLGKLSDAIARTDEKTFGRCDVCREDVELDRLELDFTACVCIDHYSDDQKRRLEQDLELSHKVQKALLPKESPAIPGVRVAAFIQPAEIVGGDYYDFIRFRDGTYGFTIADVMGKGVSASMLVASLQASLRILAPEYDSPADVVRRLNALFYHNIHLIKFISIVIVRYDPVTHVLEYCNAGHNPPLLIHAGTGATIERLNPTGAAIGLTEAIKFENRETVLNVGDSVLFYTDGATEARNAAMEEFGEHRIAEFLTTHAVLEPNALIEHMRRTLTTFTQSASFHDDLTLLAMKRFH